MAQVEVWREPGQVLGVAEEEEPAGRERTGDARRHRLHRAGREVHPDVPEEDDVEGSLVPEERVVLEQVALLEGHRAPDSVVEDVLAPAGVEPAAAHRLRRLAQRPRPVAARARALEPGRVHVDAGDADVRLAQPGERLPDEDRDAVGLLPRGAARGEQPQRLARAPAPEPLGDGDLRERPELLGVAEEEGLAHRQQLGEGAGLGTAARAAQEVKVARAAPPRPRDPLAQRIRELLQPGVVEVQPEQLPDGVPERLQVAASQERAHRRAPRSRLCQIASGTSRPAPSTSSRSWSSAPTASATPAAAPRSSGGTPCSAASPRRLVPSSPSTARTARRAPRRSEIHLLAACERPGSPRSAGASITGTSPPRTTAAPS